MGRRDLRILDPRRGRPVIPAGGKKLVLEMREGGRSARSKAREAEVAGYTSLGCACGTASAGKVSALLSLQMSSVTGERRERKREKEPQVAKKRSPPSRCTCVPVPGLSEDALRACRIFLRTSNVFCKARRVVLYSVCKREI